MNLNGIDLNPIVEQVIGLISAILLALSAWIGIMIRTWIANKIQMQKITYDEQVQAVYNEAAQRSMAYAESIVPGGVPKKGAKSDLFVKTATDYLIRFWPETVEKANMSEAKVRHTIIARLPSGEETVKAEAIVLAKAGATGTLEAKA